MEVVGQGVGLLEGAIVGDTVGVSVGISFGELVDEAEARAGNWTGVSGAARS